jgi:hypothetical protein
MSYLTSIRNIIRSTLREEFNTPSRTEKLAFFVAEDSGLTEDDVDELLEELESCGIEELYEAKKKCKGTKSAPVGSPRQRSFCRRMCGHLRKNTSKKTQKDPDSCIRQALRRWKCRCAK